MEFDFSNSNAIKNATINIDKPCCKMPLTLLPLVHLLVVLLGGIAGFYLMHRFARLRPRAKEPTHLVERLRLGVA
jgi:hypothetical protein